MRLPERKGAIATSRDGTHSSLFWFFAGVLFLISMFFLFYVLPRLISHFLPGINLAILVPLLVKGIRPRRPGVRLCFCGYSTSDPEKWERHQAKFHPISKGKIIQKIA